MALIFLRRFAKTRGDRCCLTGSSLGLRRPAVLSTRTQGTSVPSNEDKIANARDFSSMNQDTCKSINVLLSSRARYVPDGLIEDINRPGFA